MKLANKGPKVDLTSVGKSFTKEDWDAVSDNPEWTKKDIQEAKLFTQAFPEIAEKLRRRYRTSRTAKRRHLTKTSGRR